MKKPHDLQTEAIDLALDKSMEDLQTLLRWVMESDEPSEAVMHIQRARELLDEMEENLARLQDN